MRNATGATATGVGSVFYRGGLMRRVPALALLLSLILCVPLPAADAAFFGAQPLDGPAAITALGGVRVARDGQGAITYTRSDGGSTHAYVVRIARGGGFTAPLQLDAGLGCESSQPVAGVADGGRMAAAFICGGTLFATIFDPAGGGWSAPQALAAAAENPSLDLSIHGAGFLTWTSGGQVRAARVERTGAAFQPLDAVLNVDPGAVAGTGSGRSRVAIGADSTALAVWGESGRVYGRRLYRTSISTLPLELSAGSIDGHAAAAADLPDVAIEDDSSFAQVVLRQYFDDGSGGSQGRVLARRLRGSAVDPPALVDGSDWGGQSAGSAAVDISGRGYGVIATGFDGGAVTAALIKDDAYTPATFLAPFGGSSPIPRAATNQAGDRVLGYIAADGTVHNNRLIDNLGSRAIPPWSGDVQLSTLDLGPADPAAGLAVSGDRLGDTATVFVQGSGDQRTLMVATFDRPPASFSLYTGSGWRNPLRTPLSWSPSTDLWSTVTYIVTIDGVEVGRTTATKLPLTAGMGLLDGVHSWQVTAVDRRGQMTSTRHRTLRLDQTAPIVDFTLKRKGSAVTVRTYVSDPRSLAGSAVSGVKAVWISFGDGRRAVRARTATRRLAPGRTYTVRVRAVDRVGNAGTLEQQIEIPGAKRPKPRAKR